MIAADALRPWRCCALEDPMTLLQAALVLIVVVCALVLGREVALWYWKINRIVALLESIDKKLGDGQSAAEQAAVTE